MRFKTKSITALTAATALALLMMGNTVVVGASSGSAAATDKPTSPIVRAVGQYLATYRGDTGCITGTLTPLTLTPIPCPVLPASDIQSSYALDCSSLTTNPCMAGEHYDPTSNYNYFEASATSPSSVPSYTYCQSYCTYTGTLSYWMGLQDCISSCSGTQHLLQTGVLYGENTTYTSASPVMFEEYWSSGSTYCGTHFCGLTYKTIGLSDSMYFSITYYSSSGYWGLFAEDSTQNYYQTYYVDYGTGSQQIPLTSMAHSLTISEGHGTTSVNYFPGTFTFTTEVGTDTNSNWMLGPHADTHLPSGSSPTATISSYTMSCYSGAATCAENDLSWSN